MRGLLLSLLLAGCTGPDDKPDDSDAVTDLDGDGAVGDDDCAPEDGAIHPGAAEVCDGVDNDCDGVTDPAESTDATTWYADVDRDGRGSPASTTTACDEPDGYTSNSADCDDANPDVYTGAPEVCDGFDNDCDGEIDPPDASGTTVFFADVDEDGFGDGANSLESCTQPSGYTTDSTDCDDANPAAYPGADEVCDGFDNNCDAVTDPDTSTDAGTWYADRDGDTYGDDADMTVSCAQPDDTVDRGGDCDDNSSDVYPFALEVCDGLDNDCDTAVDPSTSSDASVWYGDGDGDGYAGLDTMLTSCEAPVGYYPDAPDCDDSRADVSPTAPEVCDGVDNDCNGTVDPDTATGAPRWYRDGDLDTWGDTGDTRISCAAPSGYVSTSGDCDDADATSYPGAVEVCDGADNNCDGSTDPGTASDASTWYADADRDTYGNPSVSTSACAQPSGYVANAADCDDTSALALPGGTEVCDNRDNDCDGVTDPGTSPDAAVWYLDTDGDDYGDDTVTTTACDRPSGWTDLGTDCDPDDASINPGAVEVEGDGIDQNCDGIDGSCADGNLGSGLGAVVTSTTSGAFNDSSASCGGVTGSDEAWYWTAPTDGYFRFSTRGSVLDSVMYLQSGDCSGAEVTCNDDMGDYYQSEITRQMSAGESVVIVVDSYNTTAGSYTLNITQLDPAECTTGLDTDGDSLIDCLDPDCATAAACDASLADVYLGSSLASPLSSGTTVAQGNDWPSDCASTTSDDVALAWIAPAVDTYTFSLYGSTFDTVMSVWSSDGPVEVDCSDDTSVSVSTSTVIYTPRAGELLILVVDGYSTYVGNYLLRVYY